MRAVIVLDAPLPEIGTLVEATLALAAERDDLTIAGFATGNPSRTLIGPRVRTARALRRLVVGASGGKSLREFDLARTAMRHRVPVLTFPDGFRVPGAAARLGDALGADLLLSYYCLEVLPGALIDAFDQAVNYHDGSLPAFGGLYATAHSIYAGAAESGFTFHHLTPTLDGGPVLVAGTVPLGPDARRHAVMQAKTELAARRLPELFDRLAARDPGEPQAPGGHVYGREEGERLRRVGDPGAVTADELALRMRAFEPLQLCLDGCWETVSELAPGRAGAPFGFRTSDGVELRAARIAGLPASWIAARRRLRH